MDGSAVGSLGGGTAVQHPGSADRRGKLVQGQVQPNDGAGSRQQHQVDVLENAALKAALSGSRHARRGADFRQRQAAVEPSRSDVTCRR